MTPLAAILGFFAILGWGFSAVMALCALHNKKVARQAETVSRHYQEQADALAVQFKEYGTTAIEWKRPKKHNKADEFYWLVRVDGIDHLLTDEARHVAETRAHNMKARGWL